MARDDLIARFLEDAGWGSARRVPLAGDASFRRYDRVHQDGRTAVLMDAPPPAEDTVPFLGVTHLLRRLELSAPQVLAADTATGLLLLEDLADDRFTRLLTREPALEETLYARAIDALVALHQAPPAATLETGTGQTHTVPAYDKDAMLTQAALFWDWYLPALKGSGDPAFADKLSPLIADALTALEALPTVLALRDYHADNLMWLPARDGIAAVGLLDYQDAAMASPAYDLVSLLQDARRDVPPALETRMIAHYLARRAAAGDTIDPVTFRRAYDICGMQRNSRIIGVFTRLAHRDGKPAYLGLIPRVWGLLARNLAHPDLGALRACYDHFVSEAERCKILAPKGRL